MNNETDLQKMKSNFLALKESYQDEQTKNVSLVDLLHQNELRMQSLHNEMESLQFQNCQLSKKVSILQEDLQQARFDMVRATEQQSS
jgi:predicted nuclease with TOPRIM domain